VGFFNFKTIGNSMIVIKDVEIIETPLDHFEIARIPDCILEDEYGFDIKKEVIHGKTFVNKNGSSVVIGMSTNAQDVLGLPFEAFEDMNSHISRLRKEKAECAKVIKEAGLWSRIKYAFTGELV
jgi:hypothetical protein